MGNNSNGERKGRQDAAAGKLPFVPASVSHQTRTTYNTAYKSQKALNDKKKGGKS